jgi:hypothetical protein
MVGEIDIPFRGGPTSIITYLDSAYNYSQNNGSPWNESKPCRSTSVGDVIETENEGFYVVASCGFDELEMVMI